MHEGQPFETLKNRADFVTLNRKARKWTAPGVVVQALPNELGTIRIGYTVTKKTESSSVKRNRIKRRLRAAAAAVLSEGVAPGHDYVLIGRPMSATRPYETLCGDLRWCLEKLGCRK
ncbi:MAG TPA: ribonuclease P protein component [Alphaproteobacteria bacterium]|jgi:ribonuclease P protein component|nr:ribonuclease P protein component [Micavibrio sp.]MBK9562278.1 ribonuclease P protein component [Micavibrio sp.]HQX28301.1 ribonuclease P protein component [Alphaproteobacteria bacterium]